MKSNNFPNQTSANVKITRTWSLRRLLTRDSENKGYAEHAEVATISSTESEKEPKDCVPAVVKPAVTSYLVHANGVSALGGLIFGYETSVISGVITMKDFVKRFGTMGILDVTRDYSLSSIRASLIVSVLAIGTLIGSLAAGSLCERIGRKRVTSLSAVVVVVGTIVKITSCVSNSWIQFTVGRAITGLGVGGLSMTCPLFLAETAPKLFRGKMMYVYSLTLVVGQFVAYLVCYIINRASNRTRAEWMIPVGLLFIPGVALVVLINTLCEPPVYSYRHARPDEGRATLVMIYGDACPESYIEEEIKQIQKEIENGEGEVSWLDCLIGPKIRRRMLLGIALSTGQQLTGANFFLYYGTTTFREIGLENSYITSLIFGAANLIGCIIAFWIIKDCGRRRPIILGALLMAVCLCLYAFVGSLAGDNKAVGYFLIAVTSFAILFYAATWGLLTWLIGGELFPSAYRAKAMSICTSVNWLMNFLISFQSLPITNKINKWFALCFSVPMVMLAVIMSRFLLEHKDLSLEKITDMYDRGITPKAQKKEIADLKAADQHSAGARV